MFAPKSVSLYPQKARAGFNGPGVVDKRQGWPLRRVGERPETPTNSPGASGATASVNKEEVKRSALQKELVEITDLRDLRDLLLSLVLRGV